MAAAGRYMYLPWRGDPGRGHDRFIDRGGRQLLAGGIDLALYF